MGKQITAVQKLIAHFHYKKEMAEFGIIIFPRGMTKARFIARLDKKILEAEERLWRLQKIRKIRL